MDFDFADLLLQVMERNASDLHLTAGSPPMIRQHGKLHAMDYPRLTPQVTREVIYSILTNDQRQKLETDWQIDLAYSIPGKARFRVNAYFQRASLSAAFRLIPHEMPRLGTLGVPPVLEEFTKKPRGFVLVTGPTGSGKSTTLAALIDEINRKRSDHIITIEDPIEFLHRHKRCIVNQRELGPDAVSFAEALRGALRQDPDVILLGEMRDLETISTALTAAETGHLVFATVHTQDASSTVDRLIDVFPAEQQGQVRTQIASTLQGVVTQTLLPTADGQGRAPAVEILFPDDAVRNLIRQAKVEQIYSVMQTGTKRGMVTLEQSLADLVLRKIVDEDVALSRSSRPEQLRTFINRISAEPEATAGGLRVAGG